MDLRRGDAEQVVAEAATVGFDRGAVDRGPEGLLVRGWRGLGGGTLAMRDRGPRSSVRSGCGGDLKSCVTSRCMRGGAPKDAVCAFVVDALERARVRDVCGARRLRGGVSHLYVGCARGWLVARLRYLDGRTKRSVVCAFANREAFM